MHTFYLNVDYPRDLFSILIQYILLYLNVFSPIHLVSLRNKMIHIKRFFKINLDVENANSTPFAKPSKIDSTVLPKSWQFIFWGANHQQSEINP